MVELNDIESALEGILFAAGDPVPAERIALVLGVETEIIFEAARKLSDEYRFNQRGICLVRMEDSLQLCSAPEHAACISRTLEQRRTMKLSQPALEVLAIVAYFQPVTRAYIDQVRGVDSSYTVGMLAERGLIEPAGRLDVPGRPTVYKTGDVFLRTMGITSLEELPKLPDLSTDEGMQQLQDTIEAMKSSELNGQLTISEEDDTTREA
jgi:segregation and condensation protein B